MVGDETPRDAHGQAIMNASQLKSHVVKNNAEMLFPPNRPPARPVPPIKNPPGQIGTSVEKYNIWETKTTPTMGMLEPIRRVLT